MKKDGKDQRSLITCGFKSKEIVKSKEAGDDLHW